MVGMVSRPDTTFQDSEEKHWCLIHSADDFQAPTVSQALGASAGNIEVNKSDLAPALWKLKSSQETRHWQTPSVNSFKDQEDLTSLSAWRLETFPKISFISAKMVRETIG